MNDCPMGKKDVGGQRAGETKIHRCGSPSAQCQLVEIGSRGFSAVSIHLTGQKAIKEQ